MILYSRLAIALGWFSYFGLKIGWLVCNYGKFQAREAEGFGLEKEGFLDLCGKQ